MEGPAGLETRRSGDSRRCLPTAWKVPGERRTAPLPAGPASGTRFPSPSQTPLRRGLRRTANGLFPSSVGWVLPSPASDPRGRQTLPVGPSGLGEVDGQRRTAPLPAGPASGTRFPSPWQTPLRRGLRRTANGLSPSSVGWVLPSPASDPRGRQTLPVGPAGLGEVDAQRPTTNDQGLPLPSTPPGSGNARTAPGRPSSSPGFPALSPSPASAWHRR